MSNPSRPRRRAVRRAGKHASNRQQLHHHRCERRRRRPPRLSALHGVGGNGDRLGNGGRHSHVVSRSSRLAVRSPTRSGRASSSRRSATATSASTRKRTRTSRRRCRRRSRKLNALPQSPAFVLHTGDITQLAKPEEFDTANEVLKGIKTDRVFYVPGEHDVATRQRRRRICSDTARARRAAAGTASITPACTSSASSTCSISRPADSARSAPSRSRG